MMKALETSAPGNALAKDDRSSPEPSPLLHILLAESNDVSRVLVTHLLEKRGHRVSSVADGLEVLTAVQDARPQDIDLLLIDTEMPSINGLEATRAIRQIEQARGGRLLAIAMGARSTPDEEESCAAAGVDAYLAKPLRATALFEVIHQLAAAAKSVAAEEEPSPGV